VFQIHPNATTTQAQLRVKSSMNCVYCSSIGIKVKLIPRDEDLQISRRFLFL